MVLSGRIYNWSCFYVRLDINLVVVFVCASNCFIITGQDYIFSSIHDEVFLIYLEFAIFHLDQTTID